MHLFQCSRICHVLSSRGANNTNPQNPQCTHFPLYYNIFAGTSDPYVKFKCGGFKYRSTVVNRNLNPEWNEAFSFITNTLSTQLEVKVYDHDFGSIDDYMGGATVSLDSQPHGE